MEMDSAKHSAVTRSKNKFARAFARVVRIRTPTEICPVDHHVKKVTLREKETNSLLEEEPTEANLPQTDDAENQRHNSDALAALLAEVFASISSVKAAYAQLQSAQRPLDSDAIGVADQLIVSEFENLADLRQSYVSEQFHLPPEIALLSAEIKEQKSLVKTYEIMQKKMGHQLELKESEITFLKEKLAESKRKIKSVDCRISRSELLAALEDINILSLYHAHFNAFLGHTVEAIRSFVKLIIHEMISARWDLDAAAAAIEPGVVYHEEDDKNFVFLSFVCREMFDGFQYRDFALPNESVPEERQGQRQLFFSRFMELKSKMPKDVLSEKPESAFANFFQVKYVRLFHPAMQSALFGISRQRDNQLSVCECPESRLVSLFEEMAKRVWLLHCLAYSLDPHASIFQVSRGSRFSQVCMEDVAKEVSLSASTHRYDPRVAFTVVPGFQIGRTIIQCRVYVMSS